MTICLNAMSDPAASPQAEQRTPKTRRLQPWMIVLAVALIGGVGSATDVTMLVDSWHIIGVDTNGWIVGATIVLVALSVGVALVQSVRRRTSAAILTLSAAILVDWLSQVLIHGQSSTLLRLLIFPAVAVAAAALAWSGRWLWLAALLVGVPTIGRMLEFALFSLAVAIYGF